MHTYDSMNYFRAAWICMTSIDNLPLASLHSWQPQLHLEEHLFAVPLQAPAHADLANYDMTILCSLMFSCQISILSMVRMIDMIVIDGVQKKLKQSYCKRLEDTFTNSFIKFFTILGLVKLSKLSKTCIWQPGSDHTHAAQVEGNTLWLSGCWMLAANWLHELLPRNKRFIEFCIDG